MRNVGSIPDRERYFSLLRTVQIGPGAHLASYPRAIWGSLLRSKATRGVKLTTHLHLVQRFRMCETFLPVRRMFSCLGAQLTTEINLSFTFHSERVYGKYYNNF
jgi:hypothetical protein